jgi:hypothetical protein
MTSDELDEHIDGLPTKEGKYSVFFLYEGDIVEAVNVQVDQHALYASLTDAQKSYTFGVKAPTTEDLTFVDFNGNVIKDAGVKNADITYKKALKLSAAQCKKITADGKISLDNQTVDGVQNVTVNEVTVYTIGSDKYIANTDNIGDADYTATNYLNAGIYIATIGTKNDNTTEIAKKGYSLQNKTFTVQVAKKQLTADMVTIKPITYTGGTVAPAVGDMTVIDKAVKNPAGIAAAVTGGTQNNPTTCTFAGGTTSASAIGKYTIGVQAPADSNYTGKVNAKWSIVKVAKQEKMVGLALDAVKTTIYDNGQIHFEVTRPDDSQFSKGVAQFGVIYDKTGTLAAPTKIDGKYPRSGNGAADDVNHTIIYDATFVAHEEFADAAKSLQLGNGFGEGLQDPTKVTNKLVYGANVNVVDVETGCWFRPYVIDGNGDIYYGDVCYVNLVQEATEALKLTMASVNADVMDVTTKDEAKKDQSATVLANKTWRQQVHSGYSQADAMYYVYGSYTLEGNELVKQSAVQGFGIVVDKKGAFKAPDAAGDGYLASDGKTKVEDGLKLGKGFIEGKAGSNKMDADEYGALITPSNTVTGVWVRAYIDLGQGKNTNGRLIVYTDPVYIEDVSSIYNYNNQVGIDAAVAAADDDATAKLARNAVIFAKDTLKQRVNVNSVADLNLGANAVLKQSGVIVDKSGSFLVKYTAEGANKGKYVTGDEATVADIEGNEAVVDGFTATNLAAAISKMVIGNGYLTGKRAVDANGAYTATFSQEKYRPTTAAAEENIPAVVRPFSVYEIQGKEVVIYGAPVVTVVNAN